MSGHLWFRIGRFVLITVTVLFLFGVPLAFIALAVAVGVHGYVRRDHGRTTTPTSPAPAGGPSVMPMPGWMPFRDTADESEDRDDQP